MDFASERYVRLYVRDTMTWLCLEWDGQTVLMHLLRKADRSGVIDIGELEPWRAAVVLCRAPEDVARRGTAKCLEAGIVVHDVDRLVFPRYLEANECAMSDAQRQRESRARLRAISKNFPAPVTDRDHPVTERDAASLNVTECHTLSHAVTVGHSVPCRAVPYHAVPSEDQDRARALVVTLGDPDSLESDKRRGSDFMLNATARSWQKADEDLALIGAKPEAERARALAAIRADAWCQANMTRVSPAHVLRKWNHYAAGAPATKAVKSDTDEAQQWRAKVQDSAQALDALRKRRRELQRDDPNYLALVYELDEKIRQENDQLERRKRELNAHAG